MKPRAKLLAALLAFSLPLLTTAPVVANDDAGDNPLPIEQRAYQRYERFAVTPQDGNRVFYTYGISATPGFLNWVPYVLNRTKKVLCPSLESSCYSVEDELEVMGYLPTCESESHSLCISEVFAKEGDSDWIAAENLGYVDLTPRKADFQRFRDQGGYFPDQVFLAANEVVSWKGNDIVPQGASGSLKLRFPGIKNAAGTDTYVVKSVFDMQIRDSKPRYRQFFTNILPYKEGTLSYADPSIRTLWGSKSDPNHVWLGQSGATGDATKFAWSEYGRLGYGAAFKENVRFKISLQLPNDLGGWFHGRMTDPMVQLAPLTKSVSRLTVEATPATVPVTAAWEPMFENGVANPLARFNEEHRARLLADDQAGRFGATGSVWEPNNGAMLEFNHHLPMLGDRAKGQASVWSIAAITDVPVSNFCLGKPGTFHGLVTTDAMVYQPGIPTFQGGSLNYQVGGLHTNWNKEVILGNYDLVIRGDTARCLYGFSSAPISANVSVTNDSGQEVISTTVVKEVDGWLKLAARGFTFSEKTIKATLSQTKPQVMTSITCSKGKTTKVIKGVKPTCPVGYVIKKPPGKTSITCIKGAHSKVVTATRPSCPVGYRKK